MMLDILEKLELLDLDNIPIVILEGLHLISQGDIHLEKFLLLTRGLHDANQFASSVDRVSFDSLEPVEKFVFLHIFANDHFVSFPICCLTVLILLIGVTGVIILIIRSQLQFTFTVTSLFGSILKIISNLRHQFNNVRNTYVE